MGAAFCCTVGAGQTRPAALPLQPLSWQICREGSCPLRGGQRAGRPTSSRKRGVQGRNSSLPRGVGDAAPYRRNPQALLMPKVRIGVKPSGWNGFPRGGSCQRPRPLTDEGRACHYCVFTACCGKLSPRPALRGHLLPPRGEGKKKFTAPNTPPRSPVPQTVP